MPHHCAVWSNRSAHVATRRTPRGCSVEIPARRHLRSGCKEILMTDMTPRDMTAEEFKQWGYRFVDWVADYLSNPDRVSVLSQVRPGDIRKQLPASPPQQPESMESVLEDLDKIIVPGLTHWNHPDFFAYFPVTGSTP